MYFVNTRYDTMVELSFSKLGKDIIIVFYIFLDLLTLHLGKRNERAAMS